MVNIILSILVFFCKMKNWIQNSQNIDLKGYIHSGHILRKIIIIIFTSCQYFVFSINNFSSMKKWGSILNH
jgi:hypothetical protein